jgi:glutathione S-transferase
LIPQLYNARRFKMDVTAYPRLAACEAACLDLPAFQQSHPDQQSDAVL